MQIEQIRNTIIAHQGSRPIVADVMLREDVSPLLVIAHGFKSFKDWGAYNEVASYFLDNGFHVLKFNFSHNGGTEEEVIDFPDLEAFGQNTYALELSDLSLVFDYIHNSAAIRERVKGQQVALLGHSRGGAMATLFAARDKRVSALVTWNAVGDLLTRMQSYDCERWREQGVLYIANGRTKQQMPMYVSFLDDVEEQAEDYDIAQQAPFVECPALIIHCRDDETVAVAEAHIIHAAIPGSKLLLLDSGGHTLGVKHPFDGPALPQALQRACGEMLEFMQALLD